MTTYTPDELQALYEPGQLSACPVEVQNLNRWGVQIDVVGEPLGYECVILCQSRRDAEDHAAFLVHKKGYQDGSPEVEA